MVAVVIIPVYKNIEKLNLYELSSIENTIKKSSGFEIVLIGPSCLKDSYSSKFPNIKYNSFPNRFFKGIQGYNKLLKSKNFYENYLNYKSMIIVQTDSWLFEKISKVLLYENYYFVGAPIKNEEKILIGFNGGLSIRNTMSCYFSLDRWNIIFDFNSQRILYGIKGTKMSFAFFKCVVDFLFRKNTFWFFNKYLKLNEDIFFYNCFKNSSNNLPNVDKVGCDFWENVDIEYKKLPLGCHGFWNYHLNDWIQYQRNNKIRVDFLHIK